MPYCHTCQIYTDADEPNECECGDLLRPVERDVGRILDKILSDESRYKKIPDVCRPLYKPT